MTLTELRLRTFTHGRIKELLGVTVFVVPDDLYEEYAAALPLDVRYSSTDLYDNAVSNLMNGPHVIVAQAEFDYHKEPF